MRKIIAALAVSALALSAAGGAAAKDRKTGEQQLSEMLKGRVAGTPVSCINTWRSDNNMNIIDNTAIVYRDGRTIYVNRTQNPKSLGWNDILVIKKQSGTQLCKLDQVTTIDRGGGFMTGVVFLTDFVPYTLPKDAPANS